MRRALLACGLAALAAACHDLPDLGTCGNGIVEEAHGEACDSGGGESTTCTAACELKCLDEGVVASYVPAGIDGAGNPGFCPAGHRCGADRHCRAPSGAFDRIGASLPFDVGGAPVLGDVDNDGLLDLVGTSTTSIYIRFASTAGAALGDLVVQEAASSDAPYVIFDPEPDRRDPQRSQLTIAVPTEGIALLRSDDERFVSELYLQNPVMGEPLGLVVRDPDPTIGDVAMTVDRISTSASSTINVRRVPVPSPRMAEPPEPPIVPGLTLDACAAPAGGTWHTVSIEAPDDRSWFAVITQRDGPAGSAQPWFVCRYTHAGGAWSLATLGVAAAPPFTAVLANLDADPCLELATRGSAPGLTVIDAAGAACDFVPATVPVQLAEATTTNTALLGAGQVVAGGLDELVLDDGVYRQCTGPADCGGQAPGTFVRVAASIEPWDAAAFTDLNGDDVLDLVAAHRDRPDVDVVRGGASLPNVYRADTAAPVKDLVAGDFDGDRLGDVAMIEENPVADRIVVLFGTREAIVRAPVAMTSGRELGQIDRFREIHWIPSKRVRDGIDDLLVLGRNPPMVQPQGLATGLILGDPARLMSTPRIPPLRPEEVKPLAAVAAGPFADPRGGVEILALMQDRALLYNVLGNAYPPDTPDGIPVSVDLAPPIATVRDGAGRARAVARIRETQKISVFSVRGSFTQCDTDAAGEPVELRGVDIDGDGIDEVAVLYTPSNTNQRSLQVFRVSAPMAPCAFQPELADVLEGCVDVANVDGRLVAICRAAAAGPANTVISIARDGGTFRREGVIAGLQGDGRFATAGDFDGDGVIDVAISVHRVAEIGVSFLRQCPAHDTRGCRRPAPE